jgi:hypothetical protein
METYSIIDLTVTPNRVVPGKEALSMEEATAWIDENGGDCPLCDYTLRKNE